MADSFGKLVPGINPSATTLTEWFSVPADHEYQGYIRVTNIGSSALTFRIAGVASTGTPVTSKDYEAYNIEVGVGDVYDFTMDLGSFETLVVYASSSNATFNYRGLDIDGTT